jgi:hypothetical protein
MGKIRRMKVDAPLSREKCADMAWNFLSFF